MCATPRRLARRGCRGRDREPHRCHDGHRARRVHDRSTHAARGHDGCGAHHHDRRADDVRGRPPGGLPPPTPAARARPRARARASGAGERHPAGGLPPAVAAAGNNDSPSAATAIHNDTRAGDNAGDDHGGRGGHPNHAPGHDGSGRPGADGGRGREHHRSSHRRRQGCDRCGKGPDRRSAAVGRDPPAAPVFFQARLRPAAALRHPRHSLCPCATVRGAAYVSWSSSTRDGFSLSPPFF